MSTRDVFYEKGLPSNPEAENSILGAILLDNTVCDEAMVLLARHHFFLDKNRRIFDKMIYLWERGMPIDLITLTDALRNAAEFEQIGGATYIASLIDGVPRTDTIAHYAKIVRGKALLRTLITAGNQIVARAFDEEDEPEEVLQKAEQLIFAILEAQESQSFKTIGELGARRLEQIESIQGKADVITGMPTGFTDFDQMTAGLQKQDLVIIAGRPSQGKTAIALNMCHYAARHTEEPAAIFSLEMSGEQLISRLLCSEARVDSHRFRTGYLNCEEWMRLADALRRLCETPVFIDDTTGISIPAMRSKLRRLKAEKGLGSVMVDYIQLMTGHGRIENRQQEVSQISRELKGIAREFDVPVIALSQLSRAPETRGGMHKPQLSDLRESGAIEQDADVVCFVYREEVYDQTDENRGRAELIVSKQRNGPTGIVELAFLAPFTTFENLWRD